MDGIVFGESPRWRDGRIWFSDWGAGVVYSVVTGSTPTVEAEVVSFPMCIDFLPDGRLLIVSSADRQVLRREPDGSLVPHADLAPVSTKPWNDIVVDGRGNGYVNSIGFDFPGEEFAPGIVVLVRRDGTVTPVADGLAFPNGMAVTADGSTLIVAESYAEQLTAYDIADDGTLSDRRVWARTPGDHPDGICLDTGRRGLVRRCRQPALCAGSRRWRGARGGRRRPRGVRVRPQQGQRSAAVRGQSGLGRTGCHRRRDGPDRGLPGTCSRRRPPLKRPVPA